MVNSFQVTSRDFVIKLFNLYSFFLLPSVFEICKNLNRSYFKHLVRALEMSSYNFLFIFHRAFPFFASK